jgi:Zn finger protein HypA/HybF involved in hydrogenase expression
VKTKILVECQECGKKFKTGSICPSCPKCGGSDVEVA